jgi:hypothetical protein
MYTFGEFCRVWQFTVSRVTKHRLLPGSVAPHRVQYGVETPG